MNIGYLASSAAKAYLAAAALTTVEKFYAEFENPDNADGNSADVRQLPCVLCFFSGAQEYPPRTGNYSGELTVRIEGSADDHTAAQLEAIFEEVWAKISTDTIIADLSAAQTGFTAFGFTGGIQQTAQIIDGRIRTKGIILPINCCAKDLT